MTKEVKTRFMEDSVKMIMEGPLSSKDPLMRINGVMHLVNLGSRTVPFIVERLDGMEEADDQDKEMIVGAIQALGLIGDPSGQDVLHRFLRQEVTLDAKEINDNVLRSCIMIGTSGSMGGLIKRSLEVPDLDIFQHFNKRFATMMQEVYPDDIPDEVESEFLKILSTDLSKDVRLRVMNIISTLEDVEMLDSLLHLLVDAEVEIRREIIKMIFQRRAADYKEHLLKALGDPDEEVKALSIYGLMISDHTIGMEKVKEFIIILGNMKGDIPVMKEAESLIASYLIRTGKEAEPMISDLMNTGNEGTKQLASKLLDRMK